MNVRRGWIGKALSVAFMIGAMLLYAIPKTAYAAHPRSWTYGCSSRDGVHIVFTITERKNGYEVRGKVNEEVGNQTTEVGVIKGSYSPRERSIAGRVIFSDKEEADFDGWLDKKVFVIKYLGTYFNCPGVKKAEQKPITPQVPPVAARDEIAHKGTYKCGSFTDIHILLKDGRARGKEIDTTDPNAKGQWAIQGGKLIVNWDNGWRNVYEWSPSSSILTGKSYPPGGGEGIDCTLELIR
jgi:hypothetical protein